MQFNFQCTGATRSADYQSSLTVVHDLMAEGCSVSAKLVNEPNDPCDSRALAFVCQIKKKQHTIGYAVCELFEDKNILPLTQGGIFICQ